MKEDVKKWAVLAVAVVNFLLPIFFISKNKDLTKKKKIKMILRAELIMGMFLMAVIFWLFLRT